MQIRVITKPRSRRPGVTPLTESVYEVRVAAIPIKGAANEAVVEALAAYFHLKKSQVVIISGFTSVNKTVELSP
jgi:uncharacterized protein YggU (UPF0235/DUF167 family)